jgi:hypothetical protein
MYIMAKSNRGIFDEAMRLQQTNGVQRQFMGLWIHGTANSQFAGFVSSHGEGWLTRSPSGGKAWGPSAFPVMVVAPLYASSLQDAGAGDAGGMDMQNAGRGKRDWWLRVHRSELDHLMFIEGAVPDGALSPDQNAPPDDQESDDTGKHAHRRQRRPGHFSIWDQFEG